MRPSSKELIDSISWSLDEKVTPLVDDKWGLSTIRSMRCLLDHLAVRVGCEGQMLFDDNADLATLADDLDAVLAQADGLVARALAGYRSACDKPWRTPEAYPSVASLAEENDAKRLALDDLLRALDLAESDKSTNAFEAIDAYLHRRLERDRPMFAPAFMASTF